MKKNVTLRGIVVTADSREDAIANFVAAAKGDNVSGYIDQENGFLILSNAQSEDTVFLNPLTGTSKHLKPAGKSVLSQLTFRSESSSEEQNLVNAFYTVCTGCTSHIVADDKELAKHCVTCASDLKDLSESEINSLLQPETNDPTVNLLAVANDPKDAINKFRDLFEGKADYAIYESEKGNSVVACSDVALKCNPADGKPLAEAEQVEYKAVACSETGGVSANMFVCVSDACGVHVVASDDSPVFCPVCASGLVEPDEEDANDHVATSSDDEEEEDDEEYDDSDDEESEEDDGEEEEEEDDEEYDDEEEDDEDFDSESANIVVSSTNSLVGAKPSDDQQAKATGADMPDATAKTEEEQAALAAAEQQAAADAQAAQANANANPEQQAASAAPTDAGTGEQQQQAAAASAEEQQAAAAPEVKEVIKEVAMPQTVISTNLLDMAVLAGELAADDMTFVLANNVNRDTQWLAFHKDTPVATASARTTKHPELFGTQGFGNVVAAAAQTNGVQEALKEYGFTGIAANVSVDTFVQESVDAQVAAQVAEASNKFEEDHKDFAQRFLAAASTAARGLDIGFYRDADHPVKKRIGATLQQIGVKNSDELVNAAFASSSDEYVGILVDKAVELMNYDVKVQNEFTEIIASGSKTSNALAFCKPAETKLQQQQSTTEPMTSVSNATSDKAQLQQAALASLRSTNRR